MKDKILYLEEEVNNQKNELSNLTGQLDFINKSIIEKTNNIEKLKHQKEVIGKAVELLQFVEKATRQKTKENFEVIVTNALKYVFNKDYKLELEFDKRGNLPTLKFNIKSPGKTKYLPLEESESGGVKDIASLALRLVLIEIVNPKIEGFLLFDEKFLGVSTEYLENVVSFLKEINKKLNRQIIMVTHESQYLISNADNIVRLG